jgi:transcriptional regulator
MYLPKHFEETRPERLQGFIGAHPLGLLITTNSTGLVANPIPFMLLPQRGERGCLIAHVARANPVWREAQAQAGDTVKPPQPTEALVVFQGPQGYVSPGWYPSKKEQGKVVPTWNYSSVQVRGPLLVHDTVDAVRGVVHALTSHHEAAQRQPWAMADAPADYIEQMLRAIVMVEVPIRVVVGKFKLSQNRSSADRQGVEAGLVDRDEATLAALASHMQTTRETP